MGPTSGSQCRSGCSAFRLDHPLRGTGRLCRFSGPADALTPHTNTHPGWFFPRSGSPFRAGRHVPFCAPICSFIITCLPYLSCSQLCRISQWNKLDGIFPTDDISSSRCLTRPFYRLSSSRCAPRGLPDAFWLLSRSQLRATPHHAAHNVFMTLPPYISIREVQVHHLERGSKLWRVGFCVRQCQGLLQALLC